MGEDFSTLLLSARFEGEDLWQLSLFEQVEGDMNTLLQCGIENNIDSLTPALDSVGRASNAGRAPWALRKSRGWLSASQRLC